MFHRQKCRFPIEAYVTHVRSILEYASCVWSPVQRIAIRRIETDQRKFRKRLQGVSRNDRKSRMISLNIDSSERRRLYHDLLFTYTIFCGLVKVDSSELFTLSQTVHEY